MQASAFSRSKSMVTLVFSIIIWKISALKCHIDESILQLSVMTHAVTAGRLSHQWGHVVSTLVLRSMAGQFMRSVDEMMQLS